MKRIFFTFLIFAAISTQGLISKEVTVLNDNGEAKSHVYNESRKLWEESAILLPDGPCKINTIKIYYLGGSPAKDTIYVCGYPTAGNLYPTQYIWDYNTIIEPIEIDYSGEPGWLEIDVSNTGLRSDGFDKIVIQHRLKEIGPWFAYDSDGMKSPADKISWYLDPFTPNPNFYNIQGTISYKAPGDYLIRLLVEYDYPEGESSKPRPKGYFQPGPISGGGYSAAADWTGDGFDDLLINNKFYVNLGGGAFKEVSAELNIDCRGGAFADIDNDGDLDFYAVKNGTQKYAERMVENHNQIWLNNGSGGFAKADNSEFFLQPYPQPGDDFNMPGLEENTEYHNPYFAISALFLDYNNDGRLDLFIANRRSETSEGELYFPDQIWLQNDEGKLVNMRDESNIADGEPFSAQSGGLGYGYHDCYGANATDYNNDNRADIFVANYRLVKDNLYKNNGDGTFTDVGAETGVRGAPTADPQYFGHGMGSEWADFNNDGYPDLCVGNLAHTDSRGIFSNPSLIFKNNGPASNYGFEEVHKQMGLKFHEGNAGVLWADFNQDGYIDLWHGKYSGGFGYFYENQGPPDFKLKDMTWHYGAIPNNAWSGIRVDYDNDGDMDVLLNGRLFTNNIPSKGNWATFRLKGDPGENVSMDAFGSKIYLYTQNGMQYRELIGSAAGTLTTQNSFELHFGIGNAEIIDSAVVVYPNGKRNKIMNLDINRKYLIPYNAAAQQLTLTAPQLVSPYNFKPDAKLTEEFTWKAAGGADKYRIQISESPVFDNFALDAYVQANTTGQFAPEAHKIYYWRVKSLNDTDSSGWASPWVFSVGYPDPGSVSLVLPSDGETGVFAKTYFEWENIPWEAAMFGLEREYHLIVSDNPDFKAVDIIYDTILKGLNHQLSEALEPGTKYYWSARPKIGSVYSDDYDVFSFTTLPLPGSVELISPADGETGFKVNGRFEWADSENALEYHLQVSRNEDFTDLHYDNDGLKGNAWRMFTPKLDFGATYFWRVRGINDGGPGTWSNAYTLETEEPNSVKEYTQAPGLIESIRPNPAEGHFEIAWGLSYHPEKIEIKDLFGNTVLTINSFGDSRQLRIPTGNFSAGVYFVNIYTNNLVDSEKIIIK